MKKPTKILIIALLAGLFVSTIIPIVIISRLSTDLERTRASLAVEQEVRIATSFTLRQALERGDIAREVRASQDEVIEEYFNMLLSAWDSLETEQRERNRLAQELEAAEASLYRLRNPQREFWTARHISLDDGRYLRYSRPNERGWVEYIHILDEIGMTEGYIPVYDRAIREESIVWREYTHAVSQPSISPCGNALLFVKIVEEWHDGVIIYDMDTRGWRTMGGIRAHWDHDETQTGPRDAAWLDEHTALILIKEVHGRPLRGGVLYALDTREHTLTPLDIQLPKGGQIFSLQTAGDVVYMDVLVDMYQALFFNIYPHSISFDEVRRLISMGETRRIQ
ncbi:MAG: DUF4652 domain-containing protein [Defluviitaleaceae bacterium]|nr:DUF4652 domain-containing protein [Defluviitaleaceae bacterium]